MSLFYCIAFLLYKERKLNLNQSNQSATYKILFIRKKYNIGIHTFVDCRDREREKNFRIRFYELESQELKKLIANKKQQATKTATCNRHNLHSYIIIIIELDGVKISRT